ncbi:hypothetical protein DXG01_002273 [Tephrocybe rancida]|nr:hypothetical protein DXG01_002273 [Tephrocybe rancida]
MSQHYHHGDGPSDEDIRSVRVAQQTESVQDHRLSPMPQTDHAQQTESDSEESDNNSDVDNSDFEGDEEDMVLIDTLDAVDLTDAFAQQMCRRMVIPLTCLGAPMCKLNYVQARPSV